ncbi:unnamed protein product [Trypanosoma congolense IL3000]|uniref:WGS project CAEQ00000000 data, annotated contig 585 n=1 Tax=Trypanosoma congolense (strain IL3000) TaxID=1068625 RepID=F9WH30_TRYCI|nr:unnamed protein product [Trypanosoma congolense IL3000]
MRRTSLLLCSLLIALRSLCALGVELSTVYIQFGEYVTKDNKKLDGKGARALCILKRLVNSVSSRVMFLEGQTNAYLGKARSVFAEITGSDVLRDALGEEKLRKHGGVVKLMNMSQVNAANAAEESKLVASNASKLLSDVLQWHCVGRGNKHNSSSGYVLNGNCDPDAYRREFYYNGDVNDLEKHSIPCNYKAISSEETEPTYERMERALNFWDVTKPKPDPDFTPCTDEHFSDTKQREQVSCTVLENWLQGYNDAKKKVKKLENLVLMGVKMSKYAEELLGDAKKAAERAAGPPEPNLYPNGES